MAYDNMQENKIMEVFLCAVCVYLHLGLALYSLSIAFRVFVAIWLNAWASD